jgi:hypothetical protein
MSSKIIMSIMYPKKNINRSYLGSPIGTDFGKVIKNNFDYYFTGFFNYIQGFFDIMLAELHAIFESSKCLTIAKDTRIEDLVCYFTMQEFLILEIQQFLNSNYFTNIFKISFY